MKIGLLLSVFAFVFSATEIYAQKTPLSANEILQEAMQQASKEKKNVLIIFHASWCGWCHKMDSSMNDKSCKKFFIDNFVTRYLVVDESSDKKNLENSGANELRSKYYGDDEGIPFWLIFDSNGNLLADSQIRPEGISMSQKGENVGCPAKPEEVDYFIKVLKKTSHLSVEQEETIRKRFSLNDQ
jgi:thioredoxin-related protein